MLRLTVPWPAAYDPSAIGRDFGRVRRAEKHGVFACDGNRPLRCADGVFRLRESSR